MGHVILSRIGPYHLPVVVLHTKVITFLTTHDGACPEVVFECEWSSTYFSSLTTKLILGPFWHAKVSLTLTEPT